MLVSLKTLSYYSVHVKEGVFGEIEQFYFDDEKWTVRYIVVKTGHWFSRRKVLISPYSVEAIDPSNFEILTHLTLEQLLGSPDIDTDKPISREMEMRFLDYYRWPYYWTGAGIWGTAATLDGNLEIPPSDEKITSSEGTHLKSTKEVFGFEIEASHSNFGRVDDLIVNTETWIVRYLVVHLRKWLPSRVVLLSREWVESIDRRKRTVRVSVSRDQISNSPEYRPNVPLSRDYENLLHNYYGREKYWERKQPKSAA